MGANVIPVDGWVKVYCDAPDTAHIYIQVGVNGEWKPAFRDYYLGKRTAQVRINGLSGRQHVKIKINDVVTSAGQVLL